MKTKVIIYETDGGWGQGVVDVKTFDTLEEANKFIEEFKSETLSVTLNELHAKKS